MRTDLSKREKLLAGIVGAAVFILLNAFILDYFVKNKTRLRGELAKNTGALTAMKRQLSEKKLWEERDAWVHAKQPILTAENAAGVQLLDTVKEVAKKQSVQILSQSLPPASAQPEHTSILVDFETTSTWAALIAFLAELQGPEQFTVFENANLKIDDKDQTQMRCVFKIAKWYAPKPKLR